MAVVDGTGNPLTPATNSTGPTSGAFSGGLHYSSVFGKLPASLPAANADCSNIAALVQSGTNWDPFRKAVDPTGYVTKVLGQCRRPTTTTSATV